MFGIFRLDGDRDYTIEFQPATNTSRHLKGCHPSDTKLYESYQSSTNHDRVILVDVY